MILSEKKTSSLSFSRDEKADVWNWEILNTLFLSNPGQTFKSQKINSYMKKYSAADPECLSRIMIFIHLESCIPDPTTASREEGENLPK
jgi:hypothetical protein